jgi:type IV pilus assembly protein PilB
MNTLRPILCGFGRYLVANGYLKEQKALTALQESINKNISFSQYLIELHILSSKKLAEAISQYFGLPYISLEDYDLDKLPLELLPSKLILKYGVLPLLKRGNHITLATSNPSLVNINDLNFISGKSCSLVITEANKLNQMIGSLYSKTIQQDLEEKFKFDQNLFSLREDDPIPLDVAIISSQESAIVRLLNKILLDAINKAASDIHFEPLENELRIRFRIDGILYEIYRHPKPIANYFSARLKILANLDISERRIPQDGRLSVTLSNQRKYDFRLNTCPTLYGEKAVLRILQSSIGSLDIHGLGMNDAQKSLFLDALSNSQGMILVTGPTGSGKTNTLYCALEKLNSSKVNILTAEDPIEISLQGINQVQINDKVGLDFATALRAFLRQDPNIIMIGEIRDYETADIAIKAAQTGHLVLSTLHTRSAIETLIRLNGMGLAAFNVANAILLVVAQRLLRKLCLNCKEKITLPQNILLAQGFSQEQAEQLCLYKANRCLECHNGYKGRIGIYEVMPISLEMGHLMMQNASVFDLTKQAKKENTFTLRQSGLDKVKQGITSLSELNRIVNN